jgi:hypothetical protein
MAKRFIDTDLFKKRFVRGLRGPYKLLWVYLFCECDNAGIWEVDVQAAELYCGHKFNLDEIKKAFGEKIHFFNDDGKAFIPDFIEFQYGEVSLDSKNPALKSVISKLSKYQLFEVLNKGATKPQNSPFLGAKDMDKDKEMDKDKGGTGEKTKGARFVPPTLAEVAAYCKERGNTVDPQQFIDYYTARGWKYKGGLVMKDWKAALRYWERNEINTGDDGRRKKATGTGRPSTVPGNSTKKDYGTGTL